MKADRTAYLIDAYNVLHCSHVLPGQWAEIDANGLCGLLMRADVSRPGTIVVCDGTPPAALRDQFIGSGRPEEGLSYSNSGVTLTYAGGGRDADSLIERLLDNDPNAKRLTVVSNDHRIQRAARRCRARTMSSESFLITLVRSLQRGGLKKPEKPIHEPDAERWMERFGLTGGSDADAKGQKPTTGADNPIESETEYWLREFGFADEEPPEDP